MTTLETSPAPRTCQHGTAATKNRMGFLVVTCSQCKWAREDAELKRVADAEAKRVAEYQSLSNGERRITARFASPCLVCNRTIAQGSVIAYDPSLRVARHIACASAPTNLVMAECIDCGEYRPCTTTRLGETFCRACQDTLSAGEAYGGAE